MSSGDSIDARDRATGPRQPGEHTRVVCTAMMLASVSSPSERSDARAFEAREHRCRAAEHRTEHTSSNVVGDRSPVRRSQLGQPFDLFVRQWNWNLAHMHHHPSWQRTSPLVFLVYPIVIVLQRTVSGGKPIRYLV